MDERSSTRNTIDSPWWVGSEETRMSTCFSPNCLTIRPSWGRRRSAMFMLDMTLTREMIGPARWIGGGAIS